MVKSEPLDKVQKIICIFSTLVVLYLCLSLLLSRCRTPKYGITDLKKWIDEK